jgi:broad specificity phosphatase PhoE
MAKNYLILVLILLLGFQQDIYAQKDQETFTIYLVRHAEKDLSANNPSDPPLTSCGERRSEKLSTFFGAVDLDAVYSTDYTRTKSTAQPTAQSKKLEVIEYDGGSLEEFSKCLLKKKQDALVVGHSNTTAVLAGLLADQELGEFDLSIYNRVYQVVIYKGDGRLHLLHTAFDCKD